MTRLASRMWGEGQTWRLGHRPALDGLRGVAILLVVGMHANLPGFTQGGEAGVTLFFVLSGFLITALLLEERQRTGAINLRAFYLRRAARLVPALVVVVAVVALWMNLTGRGHHVAEDAGAAVLYLTNWLRTSGGSAGLLNHTWTLAIEEQFYLLWPVVVLLVVRRGPRAVLVAAAIGVVGSLLLRVAFADSGLDRLRFGTDMNAVSLMLGCGLAAWLHLGYRVPTPRWGVGLAVIGLALVTIVPIPEEQLLVLGIPTIALLATALVAAAATGPARALSIPALGALGTVSYGLYLVHQPLIKTLRPLLSGLDASVAGMLMSALSIVVAWILYTVVEARFLRLKRRLDPRAVDTKVVGPGPAPRDRALEPQHV